MYLGANVLIFSMVYMQFYIFNILTFLQLPYYVCFLNINVHKTNVF